MTPADAARQLRRCADALVEDGRPELRWLGDRLRRYLSEAPRGLTLDLALDLSPMPGARPWWTAEALEDRNALLRAIAARHWPGLGPGGQARAIAAAARRYARRAPDSRRRDAALPVGAGLAAALARLAALGDLPDERRLADILREDDRADAA